MAVTVHRDQAVMTMTKAIMAVTIHRDQVVMTILITVRDKSLTVTNH